MKFSIAACVAVLAAIVEAQPKLTNSVYDVEAGKPFTLTWSDASGPVTITLKTGPATSLTTVEVLASGLTGTSGAVTVRSSLPSGQYAFQIDDASGVSNYSPQFPIVGTGSASTSGSVTSGSALSTAASTASSTLSTVTTSSAASTSAASTTAAASSTAASSTSKTSTAATSATTTSTPPNTGAGSSVKSSLALVFLGVAAFAFLN